MTNRFTIHLNLPNAGATSRFARALAPHLRGGDTILLQGEIGAGKSHFARAFIKQLLGPAGKNEEIPSPTYTLVQTYDTEAGEIWHADLYRIADESEVLELGLDEAMASAIVLIEWPELLGDHRPDDELTISFSPGERSDERLAVISGTRRFQDAVETAASKVAL